MSCESRAADEAAISYLGSSAFLSAEAAAKLISVQKSKRGAGEAAAAIKKPRCAAAAAAAAAAECGEVHALKVISILYLAVAVFWCSAPGGSGGGVKAR